MKMKQTTILKLFTLLISTSFLCAPSFGDTPLCQKEVQENPCENPCELSKEKDQHPVNLQETLERTYMQNATLDALRASLRATDETLSQANAEWRPSLSVKGTQAYGQVYPIDAHGTASRSHSVSTSYQAQISQNIYKGGGTIANIGKAESDVFSQKAGLFSQEQTVLFSAVQAHASVIANQDIVKYLQDSVSFYKKFLERAEARYEVGDIGRTDVEATLAEYEGAKGDLSAAIGKLEAAKASYFQIVASSPENLMPANILLELPKTYDDALEVAKNNNPDITQAKFALEAAQYNVDLQIAGLLPTLDVNASVGNSRTGGTRTRSNQVKHPKQTSLGAQADLNIPIYAQGIPSSRIRQAYQQVAQQKVSLVQAQRVVEQNTKTAWENHIAARESLKRYMAAVKAGELAVEGVTAEADVGAKTIVDVLVLQKDLIQAQIELVTAQESLITTTYGVLQAMGSLMAATLKLNVKYYDPDCYYNEYKDAWIQFWQSEDWRYVKDEPCGPICPGPRP